MASELGGSTSQNFIDLVAGSEWRFELEQDENIAIRVSAVYPVQAFYIINLESESIQQ
jgi:hypothetical protein